MRAVIRFFSVHGDVRATTGILAGVLLLVSVAFVHANGIGNHHDPFMKNCDKWPANLRTPEMDDMDDRALFCSGATNETDSVSQTIFFGKAGIWLKVPAHWKFHAPDMVTGPGCSVTVTAQFKKKSVPFSDFVGKVNLFKGKLARTVKQNQYYTLVQRTQFQTADGRKGIKCVYGYAVETPAAISYYLLKNACSVVSLDLKFTTWDTGDIWTETDEIITNGIQCRKSTTTRKAGGFVFRPQAGRTKTRECFNR